MLDHLVYATPDVDRSVDELERLLGVRASPGGQHMGRGTRNALLALGPTSYLEIVGPDHAQPAPAKPRWFSVDTLDRPRLVTWAAKATQLDVLAARARQDGIEIGDVASGQRTRADGVELAWQLTDPVPIIADGIVPFFIDWGSSPHPAASAAAGLRMVALRAEHPEAHQVARMLHVLGVTLQLQVASTPALVATIDSPNGRIDLR